MLIVLFYSPPSFLVIQNSVLIFYKKIKWHLLWPYLWSFLLTTVKMSHFKGQIRSTTGKPPIFPIFVCFNPPSVFLIWNFKLIFAKNLQKHLLRPYLWTWLVNMEKTAYFKVQTSDISGKLHIFPIFMCFNQPSFLVLRNSELILAKNLHRFLLRPYL